MIFRPACAVCAEPASSVEVIPPFAEPSGWPSWEPARRAAFLAHRKPGDRQLLYEGPGGGNGWVGDPVSDERAALVAAALSPPSCASRLREAGFYDRAGLCEECAAFYCTRHWSISPIGVGTCPHGHRQGLDPHWHPEP